MFGFGGLLFLYVTCFWYPVCGDTPTTERFPVDKRFIRELKYNGSCDKECDQEQGCWGPGPSYCKKCRHVLDPRSNNCIESCNKETQYVYKGECIQCHEQCDGCRGPKGSECLSCKGFYSDEGCVSKCRRTEYEHGKECRKCHESCSPVGCSGPLHVEGAGGCNSCPKPVISYVAKTHGIAWENMHISLTECYLLNDTCPQSYFEGRVSPKSQGKFEIIAEKLVCARCHPFCLKCTQYGFNSEVCQECIDVFKNCSCPRGFYYDDEYNSRVFSLMGNFCKPCIIGCKECTDLSACKRCDDRSSRLYEKGSPEENGSFVCVDVCPSNQPFSYNDEENGNYCSSLNTSLPDVLDKIVNIYFVLITAIGLVSTFCFKRFWNKIKTYKNKVKFDKPIVESRDLFAKENIAFNQTKLRIIKEPDVKLTAILGNGAFGTVYEGLMYSEDGLTLVTVAIKVLNPQNKEASTKAFLQEASIMACVDHPNLLRLLAVCVTSNIMLVTELMPLGDLIHYLRKYNNRIRPTILLDWCKQIANGMAFLEEHRLVHRDLAARNVLIQSETLVKVTDFGLARVLDKGQEFYASRGGKLPVNWLALECLKQGTFTHKSDVWAFGVTVWEMLTYGKEPYEDKTFPELVKFLENGERLQQPECCTTDLYTILMTCWAEKAQERPSFHDLVDTFSTIFQNPTNCILIKQNESIQTCPALLSQNYFCPVDGEKSMLFHLTDNSMCSHDYVNVDRVTEGFDQGHSSETLSHLHPVYTNYNSGNI